jgi:hypothetical protein
MSETFKTAAGLPSMIVRTCAGADPHENRDRAAVEIRRRSDAGCDDLLLFPCSGDLDQVALLAEALDQEGVER